MITERAQPDNEGRNPFFRPLSRRDILGVGSGLAATLLAATVSDAQQRTKTQEDERDHSASNQNRTLLAENPGSNMPPATDLGRCRSDLVLLRSGAQADSGGRLDPTGNPAGVTFLERPGGRQHAAHGR
jgi:hypothetical protein